MPKYDAIIIGAGFAGLSLAARFCKAGKRVAVFDPSPGPGGMSADLVVDGAVFPAAPEPLYGFEENGPLRRLCTELGIQINLKKDTAAYQVVLPDHRITVHSDRDRSLVEIRREFPGEIDSFVRLYSSLDSVYETLAKNGIASFFVRRRSARDFLRSFRFGREVVAFFNVQSLAYFGLPLSALTLGDLAVLATTPPRIPIDGINGIMSQLRDVIAGNGGDLRLGESWPAIRFRGNRAVGIRTGNDDLDATTIILSLAQRERRLLLLVRPEVLPVAMQRTVLWLPTYDAPDSIYALSVVEPAELVSGKGDACGFSVTQYGAAPSAPEESLLDSTSKIIPFLREYIVGGGEADLSARHYVSPDSAVQVDNALVRGNSGFVRRIARSVYVLPDSHAGIGRIVRESSRSVKGIP